MSLLAGLSLPSWSHGFLHQRWTLKYTIRMKFWVLQRCVALLAELVRSMDLFHLFPPGYYGEGDQITIQEALPEIVRPTYMERFTIIDPPRSHPDKVKVAINQTAEEVAAKFVEITKAYKSSVGYSPAMSLLLKSLNSGSPTRPFVGITRSMVTLMAARRCLWELLSPFSSSRARTTSGF